MHRSSSTPVAVFVRRVGRLAARAIRAARARSPSAARRARDERRRRSRRVLAGSEAESRGAKRTGLARPERPLMPSTFGVRAHGPAICPLAPVAVYAGTAHDARIDVELVVDYRPRAAEAHLAIVGPNSLGRQSRQRPRQAARNICVARPETLPATCLLISNTQMSSSCRTVYPRLWRVLIQSRHMSVSRLTRLPWQHRLLAFATMRTG